MSRPKSIEILVKFILKQKLIENIKKKINQILKLIQYLEIKDNGIINIKKNKFIIIKN